MERDPSDDEIQELLRQPMGEVAQQIAWAWPQRYRTEALRAVRRGATREGRAEGVRAVPDRLLQDSRDTLPPIIRRESECQEAVREAEERARRVYRERFEREDETTLADPALTRPVAERVATTELFTFRQELGAELREVVASHRRRLREAVIGLPER